MKSFAGYVRSLGLVALLGVGASGCDLREYQAKMDAQRARVAEFDEINRALDDPLDMPMQLPEKGEKTEPKPAWPFDVFLRLPKGYVAHKTPVFAGFPFYRFQGPEAGKNIFIVAATIVEPKGQETLANYLPENFPGHIWAFGIDKFYFKTYLADPRFIIESKKLFMPGEKKFERYEARFFTPISGEPKTILYRTVVFTDKENKMLKEFSEFRAFYHTEPGRQICIVVQRPLKAQHETFDKSIEAASLGTLDITPDAAAKRAQFKQARIR